MSNLGPRWEWSAVRTLGGKEFHIKGPCNHLETVPVDSGGEGCRASLPDLRQAVARRVEAMMDCAARVVAIAETLVRLEELRLEANRFADEIWVSLLPP